MSDVTFRVMVDGDLPYIKSTFLRSFRNSAFTNYVSNQDYFDFFSPLFEDLLYSDNIVVGLAVNPKDASHIYAWCAVEKRGPVQILHYVYTKMSYRKFDIASGLLEAVGFKLDDPFFYTLLSRDADSLRRQHNQAVYNPFLILEAKKS